MAARFRWIIAVAMATSASWASPPAMAAADDPVAFAKTLYGLPDLWTSMVATPEGRGRYLTSALTPLVLDDHGNYRDFLGYDPLADSRTFQLSDETFTLLRTDGFGTWVKVDFKNNDHPDTVTLRLVSAGDHWRLADIAFPDGRTLVGDLQHGC